MLVHTVAVDDSGTARRACATRVTFSGFAACTYTKVSPLHTEPPVVLKRPWGGPCELEEQTSERAGRRSAAVEPGLGRVTNLFGVTIVLIDMSRRGTYAFVYCFCVTTRPSMACLLPICKVLTVYVWSASTDRPSPLFEVPSAPRVRHRHLRQGARWKGKGMHICMQEPLVPA